MEKKEISIQLYTVRKFQPYAPILEFIKSVGIDNIELFGLESLNVDVFKNILEANELTVDSSHIAYESLNDVQDIILRANKLGIKHIIVPAPPSKTNKEFKESFDLDEYEWTTFGKNLSSYVSIFEDSGLTLGYHNHSYEFIPLPSGKLPIECMMEHNANLKLEIDIGWAVAGGADPIEWINKYSNKIIACHLKDFFDKEKNMLDHENQSAVGDGFINWSQLISLILKTNCDLFILEHDDPSDYEVYISKSIANLQNI